MPAPLTRLRIASVWAAICLAGPAAAEVAGRLPVTPGWETMLARTLYVWLLLGLPWGAWLWRRRERRRDAAIRNLSTAIEQSHAAVMVTDLASRIQFANAGLCRQIGYAREELIGRRWQDFQQAETPPEVLAGLVATVRAGRSWRNEWYNRRKNGELYLVRGCVTPVMDRAGRLACFVAVFEDLTEFKRGELALQEALERAEAGERAKDRFLATMSHEMRTPLNGISGFTSLLAETELTAEQAEYVQSIRRSGDALIRLTEDILELARLEAGKLKLEATFCDVGQCIEDVLDTVAVAAGPKGLELLHWVEDGVPPTVLIDELRLRQVLANLVGNAVKFTEAGEVEVTVQAERAPTFAASGQWLLSFVIRDTGIGIAPGHRERLFKPFTQADESSTRRYGGTGLGLAICKNLVELMGGQITVESGSGPGAIFHFTVPAGAEPMPARAPPDLTSRRLALCARPGSFRREFSRLARRWGAPLVEVDLPADLAAAVWDTAFVEVDAAFAAFLATQPPWLPNRAYAIVPATLSQEVRTALRVHFILLLNKPLHHGALPYLLQGNPGR
jgi:PAS domain S-box-containing protein